MPTASTTRRPFGARKRVEEPKQEIEATAETRATTEEDQPFTQEDLQRAWMLFIERELTKEQLICKKILAGDLPSLVTETEAEVALPPGDTNRQIVEEVLPQLLGFLRREVRNQKLSPMSKLRSS